MSKAPYRADQVGSLLRSPELKSAHEQSLQGKFDAAKLKEIQDRSIMDAIKLQESVGLYAITDGELRRTSFSTDFIEKLDGARSPGDLAISGTAGGGAPPASQPGKPFAPRAFIVSAKLRHSRPIEVDNFN